MTEITLKYRINGALFRLRYPRTPRGVLAAETRASTLITNGISVVVQGMPRRVSVEPFNLPETQPQ